MYCDVMYVHSCACLVTCFCLIKLLRRRLVKISPLNELFTVAHPHTGQTPNSCYSEPTHLRLAHWSLNCVVPHLQLFAQSPHICLIKLLSIDFGPSAPLPNPLTHICLNRLLPICPTAQSPHSHLSHQTQHSGPSTPMPNPLSHICLIKLLSIDFGPSVPLPNPLAHICLNRLLPICPTAQSPHSHLSHQTPLNGLQLICPTAQSPHFCFIKFLSLQSICELPKLLSCSDQPLLLCVCRISHLCSNVTCLFSFI